MKVGRVGYRYTEEEMNKNTKRGIGRRKKGAEWWMVKETRVMNGARGKS